MDSEYAEGFDDGMGMEHALAGRMKKAWKTLSVHHTINQLPLTCSKFSESRWGGGRFIVLTCHGKPSSNHYSMR